MNWYAVGASLTIVLLCRRIMFGRLHSYADAMIFVFADCQRHTIRIIFGGAMARHINPATDHTLPSIAATVHRQIVADILETRFHHELMVRFRIGPRVTGRYSTFHCQCVQLNCRRHRAGVLCAQIFEKLQSECAG